MLLFLFILFSIAAFTNTDISLPDENVKIVNDVLLYKNKPFSGNITVSLSDKEEGYSGSLGFKDGHLDGLTDIRNIEKNQRIKFTVVKEKFDGDLLMKDPEQDIDLTLDIKNGVITKYFGNIQKDYKYDLIFINNRANGSIEIYKEKLKFENGIAKIAKNQQILLTLDPVTGDMEMKASTGGKVQTEQKIPNLLTLEYLESFLFSTINAVNIIE